MSRQGASRRQARYHITNLPVTFTVRFVTGCAVALILLLIVYMQYECEPNIYVC